MTYEQALAFWFGRVNYEQRSARPDDLKLDRMRALLYRLGDPQERLRIVHVAGSKGKGSTSAMLATILRRSGYRTGLFTSPHLVRVEERIQVDGEPIGPGELAAGMAGIEGEGLTFFEVATALGLQHFVRRRVEVAVVEVGLGGRFDSTNVCRPMVSVITSISLDHTQQLGSDAASIAREKGGIIKPGRPTVSGVTGEPARGVIAGICRARGSRLRELGDGFSYEYEPAWVTRRLGVREDRLPRVAVRTERKRWPALELGLLGEHQAANAAVAVACVEELCAAGLSVSDRAVAEGLRDVCWPARLEVLGRGPIVVLDCAHNVASAVAVVDTLLRSFPPGRRLLVFAGSSDKDLAGMLRVLGPHFEHVYLTCFRSPRAVPPEELAAVLRREAGVPYTTTPTARGAWEAARAAAGRDDLVCITGSVFLAGELREILLAEGRAGEGRSGNGAAPERGVSAPAFSGCA